ncbi:L-serine ammonia-lyase [bacterium]|jgi:L-serine dehydratase|nr:L-serine ammonia-lyase [bacterium]
MSIFELFKIGIGPSSSHTVGPMKAAKLFIDGEDNLDIQRLSIRLNGSLCLTGKGHGTDRAVLLGLMGETPERVDEDLYQTIIERVTSQKTLKLGNSQIISFNYDNDIIWDKTFLKEGHPNSLTFTAYDGAGKTIKSETYYSVGGGSILKAPELNDKKDSMLPRDSNSEKKDTVQSNDSIPKLKSPPHVYSTGNDLLDISELHKLSISDIVRENELSTYTSSQIDDKLDVIWNVMKSCVKRGIETEGVLPGGLNVFRRAKDLHNELITNTKINKSTIGMDWLSMYAIAVNEENAAGGRVVTAPTNGAAGVIPSVLHYFDKFEQSLTKEKLSVFFFTAGAVGMLFKENASISGAEMGCQGEVGVASSMAAAGLAALLGGNPEQVECAAEIAMEHHLGMTCDPVKGLVQIPCIERNAMGAIKAVNAAHLALKRTLSYRKVSLDRVIKTMKKTGEDMNRTYKETSLGGLAVHGVEC